MDVNKLHELLKNSQGPKGYLFNRDREKTERLLKGLLVNKDRYGYMACPCRLASGSMEEDRDIICPCDYREEDVREFGCCYCKLYVSVKTRDKDLSRVNVPERRP